MEGREKVVVMDLEVPCGRLAAAVLPSTSYLLTTATTYKVMNVY